MGLGQVSRAVLVDGHSLALLQVDSIVADGRLHVCDASYIAFVMKKGGGQIAMVSERSRAVGAESRPSKLKGGAPGVTDQMLGESKN